MYAKLRLWGVQCATTMYLPQPLLAVAEPNEKSHKLFRNDFGHG